MNITQFTKQENKNRWAAKGLTLYYYGPRIASHPHPYFTLVGKGYYKQITAKSLSGLLMAYISFIETEGGAL